MQNLRFQPRRFRFYNLFPTALLALDCFIFLFVVVYISSKSGGYWMVAGIFGLISFALLMLILLKEKLVLHESIFEHRFGLKHDKFPYEIIKTVAAPANLSIDQKAFLKLKFRTRRPELEIFLGQYRYEDGVRILQILKEKAANADFIELGHNGV